MKLSYGTNKYKIYLIITALFVVILIYVNYNYYSLGQKIIPARIPVSFGELKETLIATSGFADYDYRIKLLAKIPEYKARKDFELAFNKLKDVAKDSSVVIKITNKGNGEICIRNFKISDFNSNYGFAYRYIKGDYVIFSPKHLEKVTRLPSKDKKYNTFIEKIEPIGDSIVKFQSNTEYEITVTPIGENKELSRMLPEIIVYGIDEGYYGAGYIIYSIGITGVWFVCLIIIFMYRLVIRLIYKPYDNCIKAK